MKAFNLSFLIFFLFVAFNSQLHAQATLSFQGVIKNSDGTAVDNGNYSITFKLYESQSGGTAIWSETHDNVQVTGGIYSVILGEITPLGVAFDKTYHLSMAVDGGAEIVPRVRLTSSPYALALIGNTNVFASDGNVGIGTATPTEKLEVIGDAKIDGDLEVTGAITGIDLSNVTQDINTTGNITLGNSLDALGGVEEIRILRGSIDDGTIDSGSGFTVNKIGTGHYKVTYATPFLDKPAVTLAIGGHTVVHISIHNQSATSFEVRCANSDNNYYNSNFNFIAIGAR